MLALVLLLGATTSAAVSGSAVSAAAGSPSVAPSTQPQRSVPSSQAAAGGTRSTAEHPGDAAANSPLDAASATPSAVNGSSAPAPATPSAAIGTATATAAASGGSDWLGEINRYRAAAGLGAVTDQPTWDAGIRAHLTYVASTPKRQESGPYASLHTENPSSRYATSAGSLEASRSDLFFDSTALTPVEFIDGWLSAPFHAIGMLRARLTQVAFAASPDGSAAGLDVIGGLDDQQSSSSAPILFPETG